MAAILSMLQLIRVVYGRSTARSTTASPHATVATISVDVKAAVVPTAPSAEDWERQGAALNTLNSRQGETPGWAVGLLTALHGRKHRFGSLHDQVTLALIDLDDQTVIN